MYIHIQTWAGVLGAELHWSADLLPKVSLAVFHMGF